MEQVLERGVYKCPFRSTSGDRIALAVNSKGRYVGWLTFNDEASYAAVSRALWTMLDEADPVALLALG